MSVEQILRKARGLSAKGDAAEAERLYKEVLGRFPGNRKAAAELQALLAPVIDNPSDAELERLLALYNKGLFAEALDQATHLLARYPHGDILHNLAGAVNAALG